MHQGGSEKVVLVMDANASRRAALATALAQQGKPFAVAADLFQGIAAVGRADFGALLTSQGRLKSLRGLCRLARKRHPTLHIVVMLEEGTPAELVRSEVGLTLACLPPTAAVDLAIAEVQRMMAGPAPVDFDLLSTGLVQMDVEAALALERDAPEAFGDDGDAFAAEGAQPEPLPEEPPLLEGALEDGNGAALLMSMFAQDLTGRLDVSSGPGRGSLYFVDGEPVWCDHRGGDNGMFQLLVEKRCVAPSDRPTQLPEGRLVLELLTLGSLKPPDLQKVMAECIRQRVGLLTTQRTGAWRFLEDASLIPPLPLSKVNPFGVILETCRAAFTPDRLLVIGHELQKQYLLPGPALASASRKLTAFTRGIDVAAMVDGRTRGEQFFERTGLDVLMGALVVMVLMESRLITASDAPASTGQAPLAVDLL